jgi:hypothetical protein
MRLVTAAILVLVTATAGCSSVDTTTATLDAPSGGGSASLTWVAPTVNTDDSPLTDLAGYYIYYGPSSDTLMQMTTLVDSQAKSYDVTGLTSGTWYFAVQAYDSAGNRSALSNIASKTF